MDCMKFGQKIVFDRACLLITALKSIIKKILLKHMHNLQAFFSFEGQQVQKCKRN